MKQTDEKAVALPPVEGEQLNTATTARPLVPHQRTALADGSADSPRSILGPYLGYVGYFVGAGLISGGIVHYPLDASRYGKIAVAGVVVFIAATVLNEVVLAASRPTGPAVARLIGASLLLSLGIGMLSGGIQHFMDFPHRAAVLVPAGLALSFAAYALRHAKRPAKAVAGRSAGLVLALAIGTFFGLQLLASALGTVAEGGHSHGAVTETPAASHAAEHAAPVERPNGHGPAATPAPEPATQGDHARDAGDDVSPVHGAGDGHQHTGATAH